MEAYVGFAQIYDLLMEDIPYEAWRDSIVGILQEHEIRDGLVAELGCGTGTMTELLAEAGYDMIGIDNAEEMLFEAREKATQRAHGQDILYLEQDMRDIELYGTVRAFVSVCDSMNYLLEEKDFTEVFRKVNNYLDKDGIFIFDVKTRYFYEQVLGDGVQAENRPEAAFIWDNTFHKDTGINEYQLTLFIQEENEVFLRFEEEHFQRAYDISQIKSCGEQAGMEFIAVYDAYTGKEPKESSERLQFVFREKYQNGKYYTSMEERP